MTNSDTGGTPGLAELGWTDSYARQLDLDEVETALPVRVTALHRSGLQVSGAGFETTLPPQADITVGDWLLVTPEPHLLIRRLDRHTELKRRAPGSDGSAQLIAANLDTLFITTSCNADFNPARLERYLALAAEAGVTPVIVLTKADLTEDADNYRDQARALLSGLAVEVLNARDPAQVDRLRPWCGKGQTVAFAGSSGVGKSTLVNALLGETVAATAGIREDDAKGRHTTTHRALHRLALGGWLIDLPGMRELGLTGVADGIDAVFADLAELASQCRFRDCQHETEPGCAVTAAIEAGALDPDRVQRWRKLQAEDRHNSETQAQRRARGRAFGRMVREVTSAKKR